MTKTHEAVESRDKQSMDLVHLIPEGGSKTSHSFSHRHNKSTSLMEKRFQEMEKRFIKR